MVRTEEAHHVASALMWLRKSALHLKDPHPHGAMVEAIELAERSLAAREAWELQRIRESTKGHRDG